MGTKVSKEVLLSIQSMGVPTLNISMDDRLPENWSTIDDIRLGSVGLADGFDLVLTTSRNMFVV